MMIDKVGGIGPNYGPKKTEPAGKTQGSSKISDNLSISEEASRAAVVAKTAKLAHASEDGSRVEKLKEIKERLAKGEYDNPGDEMYNKVADTLSGIFLNLNG